MECIVSAFKCTYSALNMMKFACTFDLFKNNLPKGYGINWHSYLVYRDIQENFNISDCMAGKA